MTSILIVLFALIPLSSCQSSNSNNQENPMKSEEMNTPNNFHDLSILSIDGKSTINFSEFKGKKVLCVNTASECGYTSQYKDLEALHQKYKNKLVVVGFPCNQFGGQEPGSGEEIQSFCQKNYGVSFLLTEKIEVKGDNQHNVFKWLTKKDLNKVDDFNIRWNFNKFLIDENGRLIKHFGSNTNPMSDEITKLL